MLIKMFPNTLGKMHYQYSKPIWPHGLKKEEEDLLEHGDTILDIKKKQYYASRCQNCRLLILRELLADQVIVHCCDTPNFSELWYKGD